MVTMRLITVVGLLATVTLSSADFLTHSLNNCADADSWTGCMKHQLLQHLDNQLGTSSESRALETIDEAVISRTFKYLKSFDYGVELPFVGASLKYRPSRSLADLDVEFPGDKVSDQARGLLKKKLLLPLLLILKLKLKALMPILVALIGIKAMKALIMSKLALLVVIVFVAMQFFKKGGMMPPPGMTMDPVPAYGAPPLPSTTSSYDPAANTWDGNGPYSRVWTSSNSIEPQNLAYNYYAPSSNNNGYSASSSSSASSANSGTSTNSGSATNY